MIQKASGQQSMTDLRIQSISNKLVEIFQSAGLRPVKQEYRYQAAGSIYSGENVYAILNAPRGDATEAVALVAAWRNNDGELNLNGVALVLTLARYFTREALLSSALESY